MHTVTEVGQLMFIKMSREMAPSSAVDIICEELQVLEAVFCKEGEYKLLALNEREGTATFLIQATIQGPVVSSHQSSWESALKPFVSVSFEVKSDYPTSIPNVSFTSDLIKRKALKSMKEDLMQYANENLLREPMAMQMVEWIQEHAHEYVDEEQTLNQSQSKEEKDQLTVSLLLLDHMRARGRYVRTLTSWCNELGLMGRIFFIDKLILILLEGSPAQGKDFILRLKTQRVDIDSSGKSCKEKMMSVLCEVPSCDNIQRFQSFEVQDLNNLEELRVVFEGASLLELYDQYVRPLCKHSAHAHVR